MFTPKEQSRARDESQCDSEKSPITTTVTGVSVGRSVDARGRQVPALTTAVLGSNGFTLNVIRHFIERPSVRKSD